jgi:hypothetical protein
MKSLTKNKVVRHVNWLNVYILFTTQWKRKVNIWSAIFCSLFFKENLPTSALFTVFLTNVGLSPQVYWDVWPYQFVYFCDAAVQIGPTPPHCWGVQITIRHTHPLGFLWTSDQHFAEVTKYTTHNKRKRRISLLLAGFKLAIPAIKRQQNCVLNRSATGSGSVCK